MKEIGKSCFYFFSFLFFPLEVPLPRVQSWIPCVQDSRRIYERGNELELGVRVISQKCYSISTEI